MPGKNTHISWRRIALVSGMIGATALLSGCNAMKRLSEVGEPPKLSSIDNPTQSEAYRPVSLPMPAPQVAESNPNSLWRSGARSFFKDQRASQVGDILTVVVDMADSAAFANTTSRSRTNSEDLAVPNLFGLEAEMTKVLPEAIDPSSMFDMDSATSNRGAGSLKRRYQPSCRRPCHSGSAERELCHSRPSGNPRQQRSPRSPDCRRDPGG